MKMFDRNNSAKQLGRNLPETEGHAEPKGHVHPNYRHWNWFSPATEGRSRA